MALTRAVLLVLASTAYALPSSFKRQAITALSASQISSFKPYSNFAAAAYCSPDKTLAWNCEFCSANAGFKTIASGGDGDATQFWYVGYDPDLKTVVVAHQGTNPTQFESLLTDGKFFLEGLDPSLFPGVPSSVQVHNGFRDEHAKTTAPILSAVQKGISQFSTNHVTILGHSLGAALALLDSVYLPLHLKGVTFKTVGYGLPRVGNPAFANYVDANVKDFTHVNDRHDVIPIVPGRFLGFAHPSGEVHIVDDATWLSCPGQDNTSDKCIVGAVPNVFEGSIPDHLGPYDGVVMGLCD